MGNRNIHVPWTSPTTGNQHNLQTNSLDVDCPPNYCDKSDEFDRETNTLMYRLSALDLAGHPCNRKFTIPALEDRPNTTDNRRKGTTILPPQENVKTGLDLNLARNAKSSELDEFSKCSEKESLSNKNEWSAHNYHNSEISDFSSNESNVKKQSSGDLSHATRSNPTQFLRCTNRRRHRKLQSRLRTNRAVEDNRIVRLPNNTYWGNPSALCHFSPYPTHLRFNPNLTAQYVDEIDPRPTSSLVHFINNSISIRSIFNAALALLFFYVVGVIVKTVSENIDGKLKREIQVAEHEAYNCAELYQSNRCLPGDRLPALQEKCNEWELCMNQNVNVVPNKLLLSAQLLGSSANQFFEQISWKSASIMAAACACVAAVLIAFNYACSMGRKNDFRLRNQTHNSAFVPPYVHNCDYPGAYLSTGVNYGVDPAIHRANYNPYNSHPPAVNPGFVGSRYMYTPSFNIPPPYHIPVPDYCPPPFGYQSHQFARYDDKMFADYDRNYNVKHHASDQFRKRRF